MTTMMYHILKLYGIADMAFILVYVNANLAFYLYCMWTFMCQLLLLYVKYWCAVDCFIFHSVGCFVHRCSLFLKKVVLRTVHYNITFVYKFYYVCYAYIFYSYGALLLIFQLSVFSEVKRWVYCKFLMDLF